MDKKQTISLSMIKEAHLALAAIEKYANDANEFSKTSRSHIVETLLINKAKELGVFEISKKRMME